VPPVLRRLVELARLDDAAAYGTFNMGAGFAFFVAPQDAARAQEIAVTNGWSLHRIGYVEAGPKRVVIRPLGVTFEGESLQIR
jgi:phosphoribosylformylglycinamidine cyclo-ligase